jgi:hypothetical protein
MPSSSSRICDLHVVALRRSGVRTGIVLAVWGLLLGSPLLAQRVLVPEREWSDATGMFKVQASLVGLDGESVTLRQTDGSDLVIEFGQLAPLDQLIVRRTRRRLAHRGEGPPQVEAFDPAARATNHTDFPPLAPEPLAADPADPGRNLVAGSVRLERRDPFDRVGRVIPVGGTAAVVLVAIENSTPGRPLPTRLVWVSMKSQSVIAEHPLATAEIVLDYHALGRRTGAKVRDGVVGLEGSLWRRSTARPKCLGTDRRRHPRPPSEQPRRVFLLGHRRQEGEVPARAGSGPFADAVTLRRWSLSRAPRHPPCAGV